MTPAIRFALVVAAAFVLGVATAQPDGVSRYDVLFVPLLVVGGFRLLDDRGVAAGTRAAATWLVSTFLTLGVLLQLWIRGWEGRSVTLGGVIPWSDAGNFYGDAERLAHGARFALSQRPMASGFTGFLLWADGNHLRGALLVTALVCAAAVAIVTNEVWRTHGWRAAAVAFLIVYVVVRRFTGLVQTENLGVPLGAVAFVLLWRAADRGRTGGGAALVGSGLLLLTLGLVARAGAFFVLPALVVWAWRACGAGAGGAAVGGAAVGFAANRGLLALFGTRQAFGYFAYTLYGIVFHGDYSSALRDHPELVPLSEAERAAHIFPIVRAEIAHHPMALVSGFGRALGQYFAGFHGLASYVWFNPDDFAIEDAGARAAALHKGGLFGVLRLWTSQMGVYSLVNAAVMGALAIALVVSAIAVVRGLVRDRQSPHTALLAWSALGILASVPFNPPWDIDTMQVQATTVPFVAALFGVAIFGRREDLAPRDEDEEDDEDAFGVARASRWPALAWAGPGIVALYAAMVGITWKLHASSPRAGGACEPGQEAVVARFDRSAIVRVVADGRGGGVGVSAYTTDLAYLARRNEPLVRAVAHAAHPGGAIALVYDASSARQRILVDDQGRGLASFGASNAPHWATVCAEPLEERFVDRVVSTSPVR